MMMADDFLLMCCLSKIRGQYGWKAATGGWPIWYVFSIKVNKHNGYWIFTLNSVLDLKQFSCVKVHEFIYPHFKDVGRMTHKIKTDNVLLITIGGELWKCVYK